MKERFEIQEERRERQDENTWTKGFADYGKIDKWKGIPFHLSILF